MTGGNTTNPDPGADAPEEVEENPEEGPEEAEEEEETQNPNVGLPGRRSVASTRQPPAGIAHRPTPYLGSGDPQGRQETEDLPVVGPVHLSRSLKALNVSEFETAVANFVVDYLRENMDRRFPINWPAVKAVLSRLPRTIQRRVSSLAASSEYAKRQGIAAEREAA